jgi:type IV pilus assembly protein PilO
MVRRIGSLPGRWPPPVRLALKFSAYFVLVLALSYWLVLEQKSDELTFEEAKEERLRTTFVEKKKAAMNLPQYRSQLEQIDRTFGTVLQLLPSAYEGAHQKAVRAATVHGLRVEQMTLAESEQQRDFYAQLTASLKVAGPFHDLGAFLNDLAELGGIMTVGDFRLDATAAPGILSMDASVSAFRYLDEEELAAQRKAAQKRRTSKK